jgi:hypothetical protein
LGEGVQPVKIIDRPERLNAVAVEIKQTKSPSG